jgi:hypothetical protein
MTLLWERNLHANDGTLGPCAGTLSTHVLTRRSPPPFGNRCPRHAQIWAQVPDAWQDI